MKTLLLILLTITALANDSTYTKTNQTTVIYEDERSVEMQLEAPLDFNVTVFDTGGRMFQLSIEGYALNTATLPKVIEWRLNEKKEVLGVIIRVYTPIYDEKKAFSKAQYSSELQVLVFEDEPMLLGTTTDNVKARALIDGYYKKNGFVY
jgi:hypothetical protein